MQNHIVVEKTIMPWLYDGLSYDNQIGIGIVFRKAQVSAQFNCPTSTVTLFAEYGGGGGEGTRIHSAPVIQSESGPANSGGTIVSNYPCHVRRRGWMPRGLLLSLVVREGLLGPPGIC